MGKNEERDEVNIVSGFMRKIICGIIRRTVLKHLGIDADMRINDLHFYTFRGKAHFSIALEGEFDQNDLTKLLKLSESK